MTLNTENESYQALLGELEGIIAVAMSTPGTKPREVAAQIIELQPLYCPWDCDHCHDDECPCDRLGCEGSGVKFQKP